LWLAWLPFNEGGADFCDLGGVAYGMECHEEEHLVAVERTLDERMLDKG
jgi:hypothetical protein